jgi:hypothetical protein
MRAAPSVVGNGAREAFPRLKAVPAPFAHPTSYFFSQAKPAAEIVEEFLKPGSKVAPKRPALPKKK